MSLFNVGGVVFELTPLNVEDVDHSTSSDFVKHPVMGAQQPVEFMGPGDDKLSLSGSIFPRALGGEAELALLEDLQRQGQAVLVTRGMSRLGWFIITSLRRRHRYLSPNGIGRKIELTIEIERAGKPESSGDASGLLTRLFGYV